MMMSSNTPGRQRSSTADCSLMYDLSGMRSGDLQTRIAEDWKHWVDEEGVTEDKTYLRHKGKPLLSIWALGSAMTAATASRIAAS